jgi:hypothetical protein
LFFFTVCKRVFVVKPNETPAIALAAIVGLNEVAFVEVGRWPNRNAGLGGEAVNDVSK